MGITEFNSDTHAWLNNLSLRMYLTQYQVHGMDPIKAVICEECYKKTCIDSLKDYLELKEWPGVWCDIKDCKKVPKYSFVVKKMTYLQLLKCIENNK